MAESDGPLAQEVAMSTERPSRAGTAVWHPHLAEMRAWLSHQMIRVGEMARRHDGRVVLLSGFVVVVAAVWAVALPTGRVFEIVVGDLGFLVVDGVAAVLVASVARDRRGDSAGRRAWRYIALACAAWLAADTIWIVFDEILGINPYPSIADIGYLLAMACWAAGLLAFPRRRLRKGERAAFWLDASMALVAAGMVAWYFVLGPTAIGTDGTTLAFAFSIAYPVLDVFLIFGALVVLAGQDDTALRHDVAILALGMIFFATADIGWGYLLLLDTYGPGDWPDLAWMVGMFLVALAAYRQREHARLSTAGVGASVASSTTLLPNVVVVCAYVLLMVAGWREDTLPFQGLLAGATVLGLLVVARQVAVGNANARLLQQATTISAMLRESESRFRSLVQNATDIIVIVSPDGHIVYGSPAVERVLGHTIASVEGADPLALVHPDDRETVRRALRSVSQRPSGASECLDCRLLHRAGIWHDAEVTLSNQLGTPGIDGIVLNVRDVTDRRDLERAIAYQATHDPLTGLANRALLLRRLGDALRLSTQSDPSLAVLFLDVDRFKLINDEYGHAIGDSLLIAVTTRLQASVPDANLVARLGGDEFVVLAPAATMEDAERIAAGILVAFQTPVQAADHVFNVTVSIGITVTDRSDQDPLEILSRADAAMYAAKRAGRARSFACAENLAAQADAGT